MILILYFYSCIAIRINDIYIYIYIYIYKSKTDFILSQSVSNLRWKSFRLYLEMEIIPSLFRDGNSVFD